MNVAMSSIGQPETRASPSMASRRPYHPISVRPSHQISASPLRSRSERESTNSEPVSNVPAHSALPQSTSDVPDVAAAEAALEDRQRRRPPPVPAEGAGADEPRRTSLGIADGPAHAGEEVVGRDEIPGLAVDRQIGAVVDVDPARDLPAHQGGTEARPSRRSAPPLRRSTRAARRRPFVRRCARRGRRRHGRSRGGSGPWASSRRARRWRRCRRPSRPSRRASARRPRRRSPAPIPGCGPDGPSSWEARRRQERPSLPGSRRRGHA